MSIRKSKVFAVAAAACVLGMRLGGCGSSTSGNATEGSNVITAFDSEPQNGLIPGNTNETGGGRPIDLLFAGLVSFDKDGKAQNEVAESITANDDATQYDIKLKDGWKFTDPPLGLLFSCFWKISMYFCPKSTCHFLSTL